MRRLVMTILGRTLEVLAGAFWLGGLTFYSGVVIETAHQVLRSHRRVGFITQQVTGWINVAGVVALAIFLWQTAAAWRRLGPGRLRKVLLATWLTLAALQAVLLAIHPAMDRRLVAETRDVLDQSTFYGLHRLYLILTTMELGGGLVYLVSVLVVWKVLDGSEQKTRTPSPG